MRRLNSHVEAEIELWPDRAGYFKATVAVDGQLAWPFDIAEMDWQQMDERERAAYLERCALTLLGRYGDSREIKIRDDGQIVAREGDYDN